MNWLQKLANEELIQEYARRWDAIKAQKKALTPQQVAPGYYEQVQQDAEVTRQLLPAYQDLVEWMTSQSHLIPDPRWAQQIASIQESMQMYQSQVTDAQAPWNPSEHDLDEVLEWYSDNSMDIIPVLDEFGADYEEVVFPKSKILVFETGTGTYVYEDESITEANEWVNDAEPMEYYKTETDEEFWKHNLQGFVVYHATPEENIESIMANGLEEMDKTRGIENRSTGSAIFTSDNPHDIDSYGSVIIEINVGAMQADGYMPHVAHEEPIQEKFGKERLANQIGLEEFYWEVESGIAETTYVFYGAIPPKYLSIQ